VTISPRTLLQQALDALENSYLSDELRNYELQAKAIAALREALSAPEPEPVALESVHLTRDTRGMCVVRVNGRVAIRDNGDIIDHMATLEWFAAPPAAPAPAAPVVPLTDEQIRSMWLSSEFRGNGGQVDWFCEGIRAAEAHHGITGGKP